MPQRIAKIDGMSAGILITALGMIVLDSWLRPLPVPIWYDFVKVAVGLLFISLFLWRVLVMKSRAKH